MLATAALAGFDVNHARAVAGSCTSNLKTAERIHKTVGQTVLQDELRKLAALTGDRPTICG